MRSRQRPTQVLVSLYCLLFSIYAPAGAWSLSFSLDFANPSGNPATESSSISCAGHAFITPSTLELTRNGLDANITDSVGRATYVQSVPLWNAATGEAASFTTTFSFQITPYNKDDPQRIGDGMAFLLGHFPPPPVSPRETHGGTFGLLPSFTNGTGNARFVAVEFDTFLNPQNADIYWNHMGVDLNSVNSTAVTDTTTWPGKNLTSVGVDKTATVR